MECKSRILIVDDTPSIHEDFKKILGTQIVIGEDLDNMARDLFGEIDQESSQENESYIVDSAFQGEEALAMIEKAETEEHGYSLVFMDVRMPPGLDGIKTIAKIWEKYPAMDVVICTAYSDYSWVDIVKMLGPSDHLLVLKKPFDADEAQQMAMALTRRARAGRKISNYIKELENNLDDCNKNVISLSERLEHKDSE